MQITRFVWACSLAVAAITPLGIVARQLPRNLPDPLVKENATVKLASHSYIDGMVRSLYAEPAR